MLRGFWVLIITIDMIIVCMHVLCKYIQCSFVHFFTIFGIILFLLQSVDAKNVACSLHGKGKLK